jgi:hypothetical protein
MWSNVLIDALLHPNKHTWYMKRNFYTGLENNNKYNISHLNQKLIVTLTNYGSFL